MAGKALKWVALVLMTAGAIATAAPGGDMPPDSPKAESPRPASPEQICVDLEVARTFGGAGTDGCREYLSACLGDLSDAQRAEWRRSVDVCLEQDGSVYRCFAGVPWC